MKTQEQILNQPVNVFFEYNTKNIQSKLKLVFDNTSGKDYITNQYITFCIEIDTKSPQSNSWANSKYWIESESAINRENWGISDENGNLERHSIDDIEHYKLVIPAKSKVTKYIVCNYLDVLREDNREDSI